MEKYKEGLVIGKFYPLHRGHQFLIETARGQVEHLTLIVCQKDEYYIPGEVRASWVKQLYPDITVILIHDELPDDDSKLWAEYTVKLLGFVPDAVFTSEDYGEPYCKFMGSRHIQVDKARVHVPCSGTMIRSDPLKYFQFLDPLVRGYFVKRICIVGAESTGTTTLAKDLAKALKTCWVPEYGRSYSEGKLVNADQEWTTKEFLHITQIQNQMEDALAQRANKILICDTNAWATSLWHQRYMGFLSPEVKAQSVDRKYDLYILTGDEIPFVQDGTRDGEHIRHKMHKQFLSLLENEGLPYILVTGSPEKRLKEGLHAIMKH